MEQRWRVACLEQRWRVACLEQRWRVMIGCQTQTAVAVLLGQSTRGRGVVWLAANRGNQSAVAGLLGWPIVTITINPRSRGCFSGPWFARRDRDNVCAAGRVKAPPWVEANRGAMVMAQGGSQQGRHGDGAHSGVRFFLGLVLRLVGWTGWMDWRPRMLAENYKCQLQC